MGAEEREDLRATAENLVADAEQLKQIETRKLELEPEEGAAHDLAVEAERVAERIAAEARAERDLIEEIADDESPG